MGDFDRVSDAISRIYAASVEAEAWPSALAAITSLIGGNGASLEVMARPSFRHTAMYAHDLPAVGDYLAHYAPMCRRIRFSAGQAPGSVIYEDLFTSEAELLSDPFYMEFLARYDMRYFLGGVVDDNRQEHVLVGVQRAPRLGHPQAAEIALFATLLPHVQRAFDVMRRLEGAVREADAFRAALDVLQDGVVTLDAGGRVLYANPPALALACAGDGFGLRRGHVAFAVSAAQRAFSQGMRAIGRLLDPGNVRTALDFAVARPSGRAAYRASLRPVPRSADAAGAAAVLFLRDPLADSQPDVATLRQAFDLTAAEADVARALCSGMSPDAYARVHGVSRNTVYTHIRRLKDKCGRPRLVELIATLNQLRGGAARPAADSGSR